MPLPIVAKPGRTLVMGAGVSLDFLFFRHLLPHSALCKNNGMKPERPEDSPQPH